MMTDDNVRYFPRLGIGEAMRLFGMTARALRFYEEKGLIEARRDRMNCRYYDPVARKRLSWIGPLRAAGLSLADIMAVIEADEAEDRGRETALGLLQTRRQAMQLELAKLDLALDKYAAPTQPLRKTS
jgi:DNA-binding transcriptional MerR regulator